MQNGNVSIVKDFIHSEGLFDLSAIPRDQTLIINSSEGDLQARLDCITAAYD